MRKHYDDAVQELIEAKADVSWLQLIEATDHRYVGVFEGSASRRKIFEKEDNFVVMLIVS